MIVLRPNVMFPSSNNLSKTVTLPKRIRAKLLAENKMYLVENVIFTDIAFLSHLTIAFEANLWRDRMIGRKKWEHLMGFPK